MNAAISKAVLFASLPKPWPENLRSENGGQFAAERIKLVVLDDDPTGTQTVHDVPVLTSWKVNELAAELTNACRCFYVLTNSRSLPSKAAHSLTSELARNLREASEITGVQFEVVSRSDSTLRGHFPLETDVLEEALGPFDATILIPYFEAGGRYTIHDLHRVQKESILIPAAETPFARDPAFGYRHSNLRHYVQKKTDGRIAADEVTSISIDDLRRGGPYHVAALLEELNSTICIVNAADRADLDVFVAGLNESRASGKRFLFRTSAEFVAARLGLTERAPWRPHEIAPGGLIIAGSHVPQTTAQLKHLFSSKKVVQVKVDPLALLDEARCERELSNAQRKIAVALRACRNVVVFTSREVVSRSEAPEHLAIGARISSALAQLVQRLEVPPKFIVAKGGITSSDVATAGLGTRRAMVLGQILPGIPVWRLGPETRFPGVPFVVFPGNVGATCALSSVVEILSGK